MSIRTAASGDATSTLETTNIPADQRSSRARTERSRAGEILNEILRSSTLISMLAVVLALLVGAILIAAVNPQVQQSSAYFFSRPGDALTAVWNAVSGAYLSLFQGGVYDYTAGDFATGIAPLLASLGFATPLIAAGLGIAFGFRAGLFNIGGQGQMLVGAATAGYIAYAWPLPPVLHVIVAVLGAIIAGALWAGIAGLLKAASGAHEVISTIMLNYVALYLLAYLLTTPVLQAPGSNPVSPPALPTAVLTPLFGSSFAVNVGLPVAVLGVLLFGWLLNRSALGFRVRAVGMNPRASRVAGIDVKRTYVVAMLISGAFVGFAGAYQVLGQVTSGFTSTLDAGIGFTAITVALLGRSRPLGVLIAGIVFGVLQAGGYTMQAAQNIDIDLVSVIQAVIVLLVAAPPLVRAVFRLPAPGAHRTRIASTSQGASAS
ncbi:ABC transporter permease [Microbacterium sp. Root553]|uniref:ABC transporter permease n=1 Tax=Microbacterium sp. Root553 TaxID=1736556 RepID=UPI0009E74527|nr:ABC transporter permease [Microbacterium sp. Root553]